MSSFLAPGRARPLRVSSAQSLRTPTASPLRTPSAPRPRLTVVSAGTAHGRRIPFVALVVAVLAGGLIGLLVLNTSLQRGAYTITHLRDQAADLRLRQQHLELTVAQLQAPQRVAEEALALGMVQGDSPAFLSLATGKVIGVARAGQPGNQPEVGGSVSTPGAAGKETPLWAGTKSTGTTGFERVPSADRNPTRAPDRASADRDPAGRPDRSRTPGDSSAKPGDGTDSPAGQRPRQDVR